jgi:signal peptidase I
MSTLRLVVQPLAIAVALAFAVRASSIGIYSIPSSSMEPTLQVGDTIIVTPYVSGRAPERGDVVVFRSASFRGQLMVKRVVAVAGDLIESRDGNVVVRGHALGEPYLVHADTTGIAPQVVPADSFYLLGDNRSNSFDSRQWGVISSDAIIGKARLVLWSSRAAAPATSAQASPRNAGEEPRAHTLRLFHVVR